MTPKTIFITGASSGIGLATALLFHKEGWNVIASMRSPDSAPGELTALDASRFLLIKCDVLNLASIRAAVDASIQRFGQVDWVVNNAAFAAGGVFEAIPRQIAVEQMDTNVTCKGYRPNGRHTSISPPPSPYCLQC